ncbi:branched-chain amino acid ABC transporter permease [Methylobacterium sp. J-072]|jgi:branched-chain amino acid transport system permease protein|uniref:branched-chain amino acid ABC transporter permease n=1 Tax=Methylobacterium sp. J-072 TaxID=2836651 RepID=UPI001FBA2B3E|nr:branched-chain amino acid ABC transporter permease [Methylobacterium sp. J-072]MCJ2091635.1 branched-chain amino acid ABC transporter permease [Methylobacterium sp. J-072]
MSVFATSLPSAGAPISRRFVPAAALAAALLVPLALDGDGYAIRVIALVFLFAALGQSWNIVGGLANQISLGHAAFFGIGAYTSTRLLIDFGLSPWFGMLAGGVLGGAAAALISLPTMRLRGHYFALATLAFGEVMRVVANAWTGLTGGPVGISVPYSAPGLWMLSFKGTLPFYYLNLAALVGVTAVFVGIRRSAFGYRLRAVREDASAAEVVGVDTARIKIQAAVISGALTAMLGTLYAQMNFFFDPDAVFGAAPISVRIALIAIVGGIGTAAGPILGAILIVSLEEIANVLLSGQVAGLSNLVYGLILISVIMIQPHGLVAMGPVFRWPWRVPAVDAPK